jgi:hypothetical protein
MMLHEMNGFYYWDTVWFTPCEIHEFWYRTRQFQ